MPEGHLGRELVQPVLDDLRRHGGVLEQRQLAPGQQASGERVEARLAARPLDERVLPDDRPARDLRLECGVVLVCCVVVVVMPTTKRGSRRV